MAQGRCGGGSRQCEWKVVLSGEVVVSSSLMWHPLDLGLLIWKLAATEVEVQQMGKRM